MSPAMYDPENKKKKTVTIIRPVFINQGEAPAIEAKRGEVFTLPINEANLLIANNQAIEGEHKKLQVPDHMKRWEERKTEKEPATVAE